MNNSLLEKGKSHIEHGPSEIDNVIHLLKSRKKIPLPTLLAASEKLETLVQHSDASKTHLKQHGLLVLLSLLKENLPPFTVIAILRTLYLLVDDDRGVVTTIRIEDGINILFSILWNTPHAPIKEEALHLLFTMLLTENETKTATDIQQGIPLLLALLKEEPSPNHRLLLLSILRAITHAQPDNTLILRNVPHSIDMILSELSSSCPLPSKMVAVYLLWSMAETDTLSKTSIGQKGIQTLFQLLLITTEPTLAESLMGTLGVLLYQHSVNTRLATTSENLKIILSWLSSTKKITNQLIRERSLYLILNMIHTDASTKLFIGQNGAIPAVIMLLKAHPTSMMVPLLLKTLGSFIFMTPDNSTLLDPAEILESLFIYLTNQSESVGLKPFIRFFHQWYQTNPFILKDLLLFSHRHPQHKNPISALLSILIARSCHCQLMSFLTTNPLHTLTTLHLALNDGFIQGLGITFDSKLTPWDIIYCSSLKPHLHLDRPSEPFAKELTILTQLKNDHWGERHRGILVWSQQPLQLRQSCFLIGAGGVEILLNYLEDPQLLSLQNHGIKLDLLALLYTLSQSPLTCFLVSRVPNIMRRLLSLLTLPDPIIPIATLASIHSIIKSGHPPTTFYTRPIIRSVMLLLMHEHPGIKDMALDFLYHCVFSLLPYKRQASIIFSWFFNAKIGYLYCFGNATHTPISTRKKVMSLLAALEKNSPSPYPKIMQDHTKIHEWTTHLHSSSKHHKQETRVLLLKNKLKTEPYYQPFFIEIGGIDIILSLLQISSNAKFSGYLAQLLVILAYNNKKHQAIIQSNPGMPALERILEKAKTVFFKQQPVPEINRSITAPTFSI